MLSPTTFADELEREKAWQNTYDAMIRKAKAGHVTGGRVFGYTNHDVVGTDGRRLHLERWIINAEAAIVGDIFQRCAAGHGFRSIAKALNEAHAPAPVPRRGPSARLGPLLNPGGERWCRPSESANASETRSCATWQPPSARGRRLPMRRNSGNSCGSASGSGGDSCGHRCRSRGR